MALEKEPLLAFIHIPKTAGNSVKHLLNSNGDNLVRWSRSDTKTWQTEYIYDITLNEACIVGGHRTREEWEYLLRNQNREIIYFAILREPQERVVSQYKFILEKKDHPRNKTLSDDVNEVFNKNSDFLKIEEDRQCFFFDKNREFINVSKIIDSMPFVIGKLENLEKTTRYFKDVLEFKNIEVELPRLNTTKKEPEYEEHLKSLLKQSNVLTNDIKFYNSIDDLYTNVSNDEIERFKIHMNKLMTSDYSSLKVESCRKYFKGLVKEALIDINKYISTMPNDANAYLHKSTLLIERNELQEAKDNLLITKKLMSKVHPRYYYNYALVLKEENSDEAIKNLNMSLDVDKYFKSSLNLLVELYFSAKKYSSIVILLEQYDIEFLLECDRFVVLDYVDSLHGSSQKYEAKKLLTVFLDRYPCNRRALKQREIFKTIESNTHRNIHEYK